MARQSSRAPLIPQTLTIKNDKIEVGINGNYGGSITYLAYLDDQGGKVSTANMVNNNDLGRQVQIGVYGGPLDYSKGGSSAWAGLGWNPIQAGDTYGNKSEVLSIERRDNLLYAKCIPKQFALNNVAGEALIEHWIRLDGNIVKVHVKVTLNRSDKRQYDARTQEFPCVYLNGEYNNVYYYNGKNPFTKDGLAIESANKSTVTIPFGNPKIMPSEPWMASVNDQGYGVGLFVDNNFEWAKGYFGRDYGGDEYSVTSSYIAATNTVLLDYNITHEFDYEMIVGNLEQIRSYVYSKPRPSTGPNYRFTNSRLGWYYYKANDTGWPIQGKLHVKLTDLEGNDIKSPFVYWKGRDNQKMYLRAAVKANRNKFRLSWRRPEDDAMNKPGNLYMDFAITPDGQMRTYEIDLSGNDNWKNSVISQIEFSPVPDESTRDGFFEMEWLATSKDGPTAEPNKPSFEDPLVIQQPQPQPPAPSPQIVPDCPQSCVPVRIERVRYVRNKPR